LRKGKSSPTMVDVAREAGVALGTVSRVVNGQPVGSEYRKKVLSAIHALGYQYNISGRNLRTDQTNIVAMIIPNVINPFFAALVNYIDLELGKRNKRIALCLTEYKPEKEADMIQLVLQNRVDGIIALTYNPDLEIPEDVPFVTIDRFFSVSVPCISSDNFGGGWLAANKLAELGATRLAFLQIGSPLTNEPQKRKEGFVSACVKLGIPFEVKVLQDGDPLSEFEQFLSSHIENGKLAFDGLFFGTDSLAWQMTQTLRRRGIRIPEDVQVIGFDGIRMFGNQSYFVSTIVQPVQGIAEACVSTLLSSHLSAVPSLICLPVQYAYGGTTREEPPAEEEEAGRVVLPGVIGKTEE